MLLVSNLGIRYSYGSLSTLKSLFLAIEKERKYIKSFNFFLILRNQEKTKSCPARKSSVLQSATKRPTLRSKYKNSWMKNKIYLFTVMRMGAGWVLPLTAVSQPPP